MYKKQFRENSLFRSSMPALIVFILLYLFIYLAQGFPYMDDSYIYYRYAANWAAGFGPVFNINEYVEGNTNFLWTAILAAGAFLSFDPVAFAPVINLFIGLACVVLTAYICSFVPFRNPRIMAALIPLVYALSYGVHLYGVSGMDTLLFSLVILLCIIGFYKSSASGNYLIIPLLLFLLNITRPEAPLYAILLLAVTVYFVFMEQKKLPKQLIAAIMIFTGLTVLLFLIRYIVYNELIPSTIQAKGYATYSLKKFFVDGDREALNNFISVIHGGLKYESILLFLGAWIPYLLLFTHKGKEKYLLSLFAVTIAGNAFVSIWAGGDFFPFHRHLLTVLPLLIIFVGWSVDLLFHRYWKDSGVRKAALLLAVTAMIILWTGLFLKPDEFIYKRSLKPYLKAQALLLQNFGTLLGDLDVPTTLLTDRAGVLPYYAGIQVYVRDIFGLMDIHNAKYGDTFCTPGQGGVCGRTDFNYSFSTPFDIFIYNSININKRFVSFCRDNPAVCRKYRFFKKEDWHFSRLYVIADIHHPVSHVLEDNFNAVPIPVDDKLLNVLHNKKWEELFNDKSQ